MKKYLIIIIIFAFLAAAVWLVSERMTPMKNGSDGGSGTSQAPVARAVLAGGCFWCVESDFEKLPGVLDVVSGYSGGKGDGPNYENYASLGHREVVEVAYDSSRLDYPTLVEYLIRHSDPTDPDGSFNDRGKQYAPAVYYQNDGEKEAARRVIEKIDAQKIFDKPLAVEVLPAVKFWPAEEYHQDYARKNPIRYKYYRHGSGRDAFIEKYWKDNASFLENLLSDQEKRQPVVVPQNAPWKNYVKPGPEELRKILTEIQYEVTQEEGTEKPFDNPYDKNEAEGIYVDILSGEPLFSSRDKYDSGTGWPSFVRPIAPDAVVEKTDRRLFVVRTEIRSRYSDSHIGHVFDDGPIDRGGKRYCMNSAALLFIPKEDLEKKGYGEYLKLFQ